MILFKSKEIEDIDRNEENSRGLIHRDLICVLDQKNSVDHIDHYWDHKLKGM